MMGEHFEVVSSASRERSLVTLQGRRGEALAVRCQASSILQWLLLSPCCSAHCLAFHSLFLIHHFLSALHHHLLFFSSLLLHSLPAPPSIQELGPPRPPLPKSYCPLESSPTFPPSVPPLPFDSAALLRSLGLDANYLDEEDSHDRKVFWGWESCG